MEQRDGHILSIRGLGVCYGDVQAVCDFTLDVQPGEIVGLVGESGSGKSTVLRAVAGLLGRSGNVVSGEIRYGGRDIAAMSAKQAAALRGHGIAYVFQDPVASLDPMYRIQSQFDECIRSHGVATGPGMRALECKLLEDMGFDEPDRVLASRPHELSGGMCQRVVLAMSLACEPELLLADEPTSALDVMSQKQVTDLLLRIRDQRGIAMVVVSHNIGAIAQVADRIGVMYAGRLVEVGRWDQVLRNPVHPYTRNLIAAVPKGDGSLPQMPVAWRETVPGEGGGDAV